MTEAVAFVLLMVLVENGRTVSCWTSAIVGRFRSLLRSGQSVQIGA